MSTHIPPKSRRAFSHVGLILAIIGAATAPAFSSGCTSENATPTGSNGGSAGQSSSQGGGGAGGGNGGNGGEFIPPSPGLVSIAIDPPSALLTSTNGSKPEQPFKVIGTYTDGGMKPIDNATFTLDTLPLGSIGQTTGLFASNGVVGGDGSVTATVSTGGGSVSAKAAITVKLAISSFGQGVPADADKYFAGTLLMDPGRAASIVYPLDGALMPQNVYPADMQWLNGSTGDIFRIILQKPNATATTYVLHSGPGFANDWLVETQTWRSFAQTDSDAPMTMTVDRWVSVTGETIASDKPVSMKFARAALTGSVYYWDINALRIKRIDDGAGTATAFMPTPPKSPVTNEGCVGCHSVSHSGRYMAGRLGGGDNVGALFDLTKDLSGNPPPTVYPLNGASIRWWFSSWNPDDTRMVVSTDEGVSRTMKIYDPFTGTVVPIQGTLPTQATHPAWSPDGKTIAYVADADLWGGAYVIGSIGVIPVTGPDSFGAPQIVLSSNALAGETPGGTANCYPTWTPDSKRIAFAHGTGTRSDWPNGRQSALYIMNADGTGVVRLNVANGGPTSTEDFQPRFSPFDSGGYYWLSFLSRRDYGNDLAGTRGTHRQQIWVTAIKKDSLPGEDPSAVSYWLPGQATTSKNISAFWAPRACLVDGESCAVNSECCGGDCRQDGNGNFVCTPPPPEACRQLNDTCTTSADCCDGRECLNKVCVDPLPK